MEDEALKAQGPPDTYDHTMLSQYADCPRKLYWFMRGFKASFMAPALVAGLVWHLLLSTWYVTHTKDAKDIALDAGEREWIKHGVEGQKHDSWENIKQLFEIYTQSYPKEFEPFTIIDIEQGFQWPIPGTRWFLGGSIDMYVDWPPYGPLIWENKSTSMYLTDNFIGQWSHSQQITGYVWALTQLLNREIWGCLVNLACKRIPKRKEPENLFSRPLERRTTFQLDEYIANTKRKIEQIHESWRTWTWDKTWNPINCAGGIGRTACIFRPVCLQDDKFWKLNPTFFPGIKETDEPWEPWKRDQEVV